MEDHREADRELADAEAAIMATFCPFPEGMGFDEIYQKYVDYGSQDWASG